MWGRHSKMFERCQNQTNTKHIYFSWGFKIILCNFFENHNLIKFTHAPAVTMALTKTQNMKTWWDKALQPNSTAWFDSANYKNKLQKQYSCILSLFSLQRYLCHIQLPSGYFTLQGDTLQVQTCQTQTSPNLWLELLKEQSSIVHLNSLSKSLFFFCSCFSNVSFPLTFCTMLHVKS